MAVMESNTIRENPGLSQTDINAGFETRDYDNKIEVVHYYTSDSVNRRLRTTKIKVTDMGHPYEIPQQFREYSKIMLEHQLGQVEPGQFENHRICGMYSDLKPDTDTVTIGMVEYYDLLATFYSFPYVYRNDKGIIEFKGSSYIYNDFGVIYPLSIMLGANPIGANSIAITTDNKILIHKQDDNAHINPGLLMPTGSGSCSWHDYIDINAEYLQDIVIHGAEYKMRHECKIPENCPMTTKVMGMARVPIGMKPDFYCFTELGMSWDELKAAGAEAYDVIEAEGHGSISDALIAYVDQKNAEKIDSVSIQLYLEAIFLAEICR
ncbi:MAG: hypothetical protein IKF56_04540 [Eggerthellaceae bacterium]|nr:hypothetical protein [Eggerthellaceae bacterium]